jgi:hypothetical protein
MPLRSRWKEAILLKRHSAQTLGDDGYVRSEPPEELTILLNVQPAGKQALSVLPEGARLSDSLVAYGDTELNVSDQATGVAGDWIKWGNRWYACVSCVWWGHTRLSHYESYFVRVPESEVKPDDA